MNSRITYYEPQMISPTCENDAAMAVRNPDSSNLVIVFTGLARKFGFDLTVFYSLLPKPKPNVLFLADPNRMVYLDGVPAFGATVEATVAGIRDLIEEWGVKRVFTVGSSGGSFAAAAYGVRLGAKRSMAFAPFTCYLADADPRVARYIAKFKLSENVAARDPTSIDLSLFIPKHNKSTEILFFYGAGCKEDARQVDRVRGLENVVIVPIDGCYSHVVQSHMRRQGQVEGVLEQLIKDEAFEMAKVKIDKTKMDETKMDETEVKQRKKLSIIARHSARQAGHDDWNTVSKEDRQAFLKSARKLLRALERRGGGVEARP